MLSYYYEYKQYYIDGVDFIELFVVLKNTKLNFLRYQ